MGGEGGRQTMTNREGKDVREENASHERQSHESLAKFTFRLSGTGERISKLENLSPDQRNRQKSQLREGESKCKS